MKNKTSISKSIATLLCIITITISFNIYMSYKDLYISNDLPRDSIIYIALAKSSLKDPYEYVNNKNIPSIKAEEIHKNKSTVNLIEDNIQKKTKIIILKNYLVQLLIKVLIKKHLLPLYLKKV